MTDTQTQAIKANFAEAKFFDTYTTIHRDYFTGMDVQNLLAIANANNLDLLIKRSGTGVSAILAQIQTQEVQA